MIALLVALLGLWGALPAAAIASPTEAGVLVASTCVSPIGEYGGMLSFQLSGVDPLVVTASHGNTLTITGRYTNTGKNQITDLGYKFQRGDPMTSTAEIQEQTEHPCQPIAVIDSGFQDLPGTLKAGASADFTAAVPITGSTTKTLAITRPGVYPVMININATLHVKGEKVRARVGELHLMVTVLSVPTSNSGGTAIPDGPSTSSPGIPLSMLWPIVDGPHLGVDGVFTDDELATEIVAGGRLASLVDTLQDSRADPGTVTLVIDPMLLDELDRMSRGYWVVAQPGTAQPPLTPTVNASATETSTSAGASSAATGGPTTGSVGNTNGAVQSGPVTSRSELSVTGQSTGSFSATAPETGAAGADTAPETAPGTPASTVGEPTTTNPIESDTPDTKGQPPATGSGARSSALYLPGRAGQVQSADQATGPATPDGTPSGEVTSANSAAGGAATTPVGPAGSRAGAGAVTGTGSEPTGGTGDAGTTPSGAATSTTPPSTTPPSTTPPSTEPPTTLPSTTPSTTPSTPSPQPPGTVAGDGSRAATAFLDRLRELARHYQVLVLPYADPDVVALVRAGMTDELATAVYRGRAVATRVLQQRTSTVDTSSNLVTTVAFPPGGLLDEATLRELHQLGYTSAVLATDGITEKSTAPIGVVPVALDRGSVPALVSDATLVSDIGRFVYSGVPDDWPDRVNLLAALMAQQHFDRTGTPMVLVPDRNWSPDRSGFTLITTLLQVMAGEGVVTGTTLPALAATGADAPASATLNYPDDARQRELSADYLDSLRDTESRIAVLGEALTADPGPDGADPVDILDPLREALLGAVSTSLRGEADPEGPVLQTVADTLDSLYGGVRIRRGTGSYTLASSSSPLLLTVQNTLPYQVSVTVAILGGGPVGLNAHDPGRITIAAGPRTKQVTIATEVSRSGTFTVLAQLRGPNGASWGSPVPLTIASRAYGTLTLVLMLVAGGILVLMVAFRIHQRWRARRQRLAAEAIAAATDTEATAVGGSARPGGDGTNGDGAVGRAGPGGDP